MRGQVSNGMLCSARELELGDDHAGILILPTDVPLGEPVTDALGMRSDVVYDFDALPNRPDTLSVLGVARDLAARQKVRFEVPRFDPTTAGEDASTLASVRHRRRRISAVASSPGSSPASRSARRRVGWRSGSCAAGMRPINNVVDVSNYVMLELGQPNHTYDLAKVAGGQPRGPVGACGGADHHPRRRRAHARRA